MKTRFRLLPTILVCLGTLVLVSAGSILALNLFTTTSVVSELVFRLVNQNLRGLELALRNYLDPATHEAEFLSGRIRSGEIDFSDRGRLAEVAIGALGAVPQVTTLVVASADGSTLQVSRTPSDDIDARWLPAGGSQLRESRAREIEARAEPFWGPPIYAPRLNRTVVNLRMPIRRGDDYLGFVGVGISTQALSELAASLSNPPHSTVFVLYGRDQVLAHASLTSQSKAPSADRPLLAKGEIGDLIVAGLDDAELLTRVQASGTENIKIRRAEIEGTRYLVITKPITGYGDVPLEIGAYSVASEVNAPFRCFAPP